MGPADLVDEPDPARWDRLRSVGDPLADAVVAEHFAGGGPPAALFGALVRRTYRPAGDPDDPDDPVGRYLAEQPAWPAWADPAVVRRGQQVFERWGPQILPSLLLASLPEAYAAAKGVQVLALTARLATDPRRRLVETTQLTVDAMSVGGLDVGARGYTAVRRVRLMHAAIRYLIAHDPLVTHTCDPSVPHRWCPGWGTPINQEDLLGTLVTFTTVVLESLERFGVHLPEADAEAYVHAWSLAGHLLGIDPDLLPFDVATARRVQEVVRARQFAASEAGRYMAAALEGLAASQMRPRWLSGLPRTTTRHLVGEHTADLLGLAPADWTRVFFAPARRVLTAMSLQEQHDRLVRGLATRLNRRFVDGFVDVESVGDRATFALPTHLADAWAIPAAPAARRSAGASGTG